MIRDKLGICQWFHYQDYETVKRAVVLLKELNCRHLRTGISWADFHRSHGPRWYRWMLDQLADFEILLSVWHTPPSIAEGFECSGPPRRLEDFADFLMQVEEEYGDAFASLELWNEPNNRYKWNFLKYDPQWEKFGKMIASAGVAAQRGGKPVVLGGMIPVDSAWLQLVSSHGALRGIDVIAIHGFPEMWWAKHPNWDWAEHWHGWRAKVQLIEAESGNRPVWITETGLATWDLDQGIEDRHELQSLMLRRAIAAPVERVYWYSLIDLDPSRDAIEGFHIDENEYHLGLVTWDGRYKPAFVEFQRLLGHLQASVSPKTSGSL